MNTLFTKNFSKNYMILDDFPDYEYSNDFRLEMLSYNSIPGTLDFSYELINNKPLFKYDITSKQAFSSLFSTEKITYKAFIAVLLSLIDVIGSLEEYLINTDSLILKSEYIFLDPEKYTTYFTICPAHNNDFYAELNNFFNDVLKKIDHNDDKLVLLSYRLATISSKDGFNISMLKSILISAAPPDKENATDFAKPQKNLETTISSENISTINDFSENDNLHFNVTENSNNSSDLSTQFKKFWNNSTFIHKNSTKTKNLYTISTGFYTKVIFLTIISLIVLSIGIYLLASKNASFELSMFVIVLDICFSIGSIRYLIELYPTSKIPQLGEHYRNNVSHFDNLSNDNEEEINFPLTISKSNTPEKGDETEEYGDTVILNIHSKASNHRLVYTGADFIDNVPINTYPFTIGKLKNSVNMIINNPLISRIHACIYSEDNNFYIEDLNSSNGTYINDILLRPHERFPLKEGDLIKFSHLVYVFE